MESLIFFLRQIHAGFETMTGEYSVYSIMLGDIVAYYGSTSRDVEERYGEHLRSARLSEFSSKELLFSLGRRRDLLSCKVVEDCLTKKEAVVFERELILQHRPWGNETYLVPRHTDA